MKLINSSFEILNQTIPHYKMDMSFYTFQHLYLDEMYKHIELCGRTCYLPDTEVLTDSGWKRIDTITENDNVVSYNPENNSIIYDKPNMVSHYINEYVISINHPQIKATVTGNHRIYQSIPAKREYSFLTANQLIGREPIPHSRQNRFRLPKYFIGSSREHNSNLLENIEYTTEVKHGRRPTTLETISLSCNEALMCLLGSYIAEGHTFHGEASKTGSYCQITQTENTELYNDVISALNNLNIKYSIDFDRRKPYIKWIKFGNKVYVELFESLCGRGSHNKHLPEWFRSLPDSYINILLKYMYLGDGSHNKTRQERYLSVSKRLLDEVQECFILLGKNGTVSYDATISQKCYFEENKTDSWIISRSKHLRDFKYTGFVYCTSTKSGIICIRKDGKAFWCGNCYKSQDKITEDSAKPFVDRMIASKHYAMLEHGTVYLYDTYDVSAIGSWTKSLGYKYSKNKYSKVTTDDDMDIRGIYITTNLRVIAENDWWDDLKYICEPTEFHKKRYTVKFICDIGVSREFCRHRVFSFANESTRYCNYNKNRFNGEVIYIEPLWYKDADSYTKNEFDKALEFAEGYYKFLIDKGYKAQDARNILPLATKSELIMTGFEDDWKHFFDLRALGTTGAPHPQAEELAAPLMKKFINKGYIKPIV